MTTPNPINPTCVNGLCINDWPTFYTKGEERSVTGRVVRIDHGAYDGDYATVYLDVDGMEYAFGTGGHLGNTWTTESGSEEWFMTF
jgi:hypothetical protein